MQGRLFHILFRVKIVWLLWLCLPCCSLFAQKEEPADTVFFLANKKGLLGKIGRSLSVNNPDPVIDTGGAQKNETPFQPYKGKIIRKILVEKLSFNRSVNDTTKVTRNFFNDLGNTLHTSTSNRIIKNNLFFVQGDTLYPYLLADNERFLRELTYLQDARITIKETQSLDSVDVVVVCKDVFPFGGSMEAGDINMASFEVNDDNLFGQGNRLQLRNYYDNRRSPSYGIGFEFLKRNIAGTFLNVALGYRNEAPTFNTGLRQEKALYVLGDLPLVSPYHAWTGGFEIGEHFTENAYVDDSLYRNFLRYDYRVFDGWMGYNLGARNRFQENFKSRYKRLVSIRAVHRMFKQLPDYYKSVYNIAYSDLVTVLGSFTIFEQDYYHTNFLYGFGRNEDVPEGFSITLTGGWSNRNRISRPYGGFEYQRAYFSNRKNYINYTLRAGAYLNAGRIEDISFLSSVEYFTKLRRFGQSKWYVRHFLSGSITQLANTLLNEPLRLGSDYGIPQLGNPNLYASTRATFNAETVFYNTWKFVGFSFAPFVFSNVTYLKRIGQNVRTGDIFGAVGGGVRTRNENLVFGTIELKAYYYPRVIENMNHFNVTLNTGLRFRYISQLIKRPDYAIVN